MADLFAEWDSKRDRATQPATPTTQTVTPGRATAYALAALQGEVANLLAVPIGSGRNDQLNKSALKMGQLVAADAIDEHTVIETLGAADGGLDYEATRKTITSGLTAGKAQARTIPDTTTTTTREAAPWETIGDDPFADVYTGPMPGPSAGTAGTTGTPSSGDSTSITVGGTSPDSADAATSSADPYAALVALEASQQRLRRDARRLIDAEDAVRDFRIPPYLPNLTAELLLPDEPVTYAVDALIPTGANVLLTAQFKTGKTTLVNNLARALADRVPFLGRYEVADLNGRRVALFNYEVDGRQYRRWLRDAGITNTDAIAVLNLRGYRLPLIVSHIETWVVEWLKRADVAVWVVDPFARAAVGSILSENDNTEVGAFLDTLDVIKDRAGVSELILPTHTGRAEQEQGEERARGATRLDDWADVRWLLTKDKRDGRYFRATGRDVETDEAALEFDETTRELTLVAGSRWSAEQDAIRNAILTVVRDRPGVGARDLRDAAKIALRGVTAGKITDAVDDLVGEGKMHRARQGHTVGHFTGRAANVPVEPDPDPFL